MTVFLCHFAEICNDNEVIYMRHLILILCMTIATVLMTATATIALPACPSSGYFHNCFGTYSFADGRRELGEYKDDALNGYAIQYHADGSIFREGIFKNDEFLYAQNGAPKTPHKSKTPKMLK